MAEYLADGMAANQRIEFLAAGSRNMLCGELIDMTNMQVELLCSAQASRETCDI
jgi:hypothetical protein